MGSYLQLSLGDVVLSLTFVVVAITVSLRSHLALERTLLWATFRTLVQLAAVGYLIHLLFAARSPLPVLALLVVMLLVAGWTATSRQPLRRLPLYPLTLFSLLIGSGVTLAIVLLAVVAPRPWYDPQYLIPLGGIILGNAMNAVALGLERLERELVEGRKRVEVVLALGGTPSQAAAAAERQAVRAALIPVINSMMVVGLVQLPGVMTGQILAGADPWMAVRYQAVVIFMLLSGNALSTTLAVRRARGRYFTRAWQLRLPR
jgi:putative ABC transport system permease protein